MTQHSLQRDSLAPDRVKPSLLGRLRNQIKRVGNSESGTASLDFIICVPVIMALFMASMESGLLMTRYIMLEHSVDNVMRKLRLGQYPNPTSASLKQEICEAGVILKDCNTSISIDMAPVSTETWDFPTDNAPCVDRSTNIEPSTTFNPGAAHEIVMVRVCVIQEAIFPTLGIGLKLPKEGGGGYGLVAVSAFVNEP